MARIARIAGLLLIAAIGISSCNLPGPGAGDESDLMSTAAAQTVEVMLTQAAGGATQSVTHAANAPTNAAAATNTALALSTNTPQPTYTPLPTNTQIFTATPLPCDMATFVDDITVPDGTEFNVGQSFTKTWRLRNAGSCTWTTAYAVVYVSGDQMSGPVDLNLTGNVYPGQTVDITLGLKAPNTAGTYRGNWKIRNDKGQVFGLTNGNPFWVDIKAKAILAPPVMALEVYNFATSMCSAEWKTYPPLGAIPCPGTTSDEEGFVVMVGNPTMEDNNPAGQTSIETHPRFDPNGLIQGKYPPVVVTGNSRFLTKIGCRQNGGACSVKYQVNYYADGDPTLKSLGTWTETYDGSLRDINIDLSSLSGKSLQFILVVTADGNSAQDWAIWINPRIMKYD